MATMSQFLRMISFRAGGANKMNSNRSVQSVAIVLLTFFLLFPVTAHAQSLSNMLPSGASQAPAALTSDQQSLANKALCSALSSQTSNPASASPSMLNNPTVMTAAASSFAGSTKLPLPSATSLLQGYVAQHATGILASCAVSNATSGLTNQIPGGGTSQIPGGGSMPSMPKY
jgi:hypothetical protein